MDHRLKGYIKITTIYLVIFPVFDCMVQPILVMIHPMFRDHNVPADQVDGFLPKTGEEWAFL